MNDFYPVRRRGEPRRLNPDWEAIACLEQDLDDDTEIIHRRVMIAADEQLIIERAAGSVVKQYRRPMIQPLPLGATSTLGQQVEPCPDCYDFHRTWACAEHPELPYNHKTQQWVTTSSAPFARLVDSYQAALYANTERALREAREFCNCRRCQNREVVPYGFSGETRPEPEWVMIDAEGVAGPLEIRVAFDDNA